MKILVSDTASGDHANTCKARIEVECPTAYVEIYIASLQSSISYAMANGFQIISRSTTGLADDDLPSAILAWENSGGGAFDVGFGDGFDVVKYDIGIVHAHGSNSFVELNVYTAISYICAVGDLDGSYGNAFEFYSDEETTQSYATARIAGIIAQLMVDHPTWNFFDARGALQMTASFDAWNKVGGFGAVNKTLATAVTAPLFIPTNISVTEADGYVTFAWRKSLQNVGTVRTCIKRSTNIPTENQGIPIYIGTDESFLYYVIGDYYYQFYTVDDDENMSPFGEPIYISASGGENVWINAILSTTTSLAKYESEINDLTSGTWANAIALAKEILGDKLEIILTNRGYSVDEDEAALLDIIENPTVFNMTSDYLTLALIYEDLSQGMEGLYKYKSEKYYTKFEKKFDEDVRRLNLDTNVDGTVDSYRMDWEGKFER